MYAGRSFPNIEAGEVDIFSFEFTPELANGRTIISPVFTCSLSSTDANATPDPAPSSRILGLSNITTETNPVNGDIRTFSNQQIGNLMAGNKYTIECSVATSDGCTLKLNSHVYCKPVT